MQEDRYIPLNATYPSVKATSTSMEYDVRRKILQPISGRTLDPDLSERDAKRPRAPGPMSGTAVGGSYRGRDDSNDFINEMLGGGGASCSMQPAFHGNLQKPTQPIIPQTDFSCISHLKSTTNESIIQPFAISRPLPASAAADLPNFTTIAAHGIAPKDTRGLGSYNDPKVNSIPFPEMLQQRQQQLGIPTFGLGPGAAALPSLALANPPPPQTVPVSLLPFDWSLKKFVWLTSPQPFRGLQTGGMSTRLASLAEAACMSGSTANLDDPHACLHAAMLSWRHPEASWDPLAVAALAKEKQGSPSQRLWVQRRQNWGSALTSLYHGLRHQQASGPVTHCGAFYIIQAAPKAKHATVALFTAAGTRGCPHPAAMLSCSCSALRSRMAAAGLQWDTPLERASTAAAAGATAAKGSNAGGLSRSAKGGGSNIGGANLEDEEPEPAIGSVPNSTLHDGTPSSQLSFVGAERVHSLFDFLLNDTHTPLAGSTGSQQPDVPMLLSPTHFAGGVAWRPQIKVSSLPPPMFNTLTTRVTATIPGHPTSTTSSSTHHSLQLLGPLPPWTTARLLRTLATHHSTDFDLALVTETCCIGVNASRAPKGGHQVDDEDDGVDEGVLDLDSNGVMNGGAVSNCGPGVHSFCELVALRTLPKDAALGGWSMQSVAVKHGDRTARFVLA